MAATRLGERFRLEERISATGGLSMWKATDEVLAAAWPRRSTCSRAARRSPQRGGGGAGRGPGGNDSRLAMIYDTDYAEPAPGHASEWTRGTHLEDLVLSGLPSPALAAAMIADAADALAVAHEAGRPHLCLSRAACAGTTAAASRSPGSASTRPCRERRSDDPAAADTRALAQMLYALLDWVLARLGSRSPCRRRPGTGAACTPRGRSGAGVPGALGRHHLPRPAAAPSGRLPVRCSPRPGWPSP